MDKSYWRRIRQACQLCCLGVFFYLFRITDDTGAEFIGPAVDLIFRLDPLVGACVTLATRTFLGVLWPCLVVLALTLILGRVFCGWVCPLGTLLDMAGRLARPGNSKGSASNKDLLQGSSFLIRYRFLKYCILIVLLVSSLFSVQFIGFFDPFSLLVRGLTFSLDPIFNFLVQGVFDWIYFSAPGWVSSLTEPVYDGFKTHVLPFRQSFFYLSFISFFLLAGIFCLEWLGRRGWCRALCPLGALLALVPGGNILKRVPDRACRGCDLCRQDCPMGAFDDQGRILARECNMCMNCLDFCPTGLAGFRVSNPGLTGPAYSGAVDISRRKLLASGAFGLCMPMLSRTHALGRVPDNDIIRPPGALNETGFLAACVRCGACMKICITNGLQPLGPEKGLTSFFTPVLVPRLGYCEFNCTLCSQVCPTRAILPLAVKEKQGYVMGRAWIDRSNCLPWAHDKNCIVCEEHCPVHDKAIILDRVRAQRRDGSTLWLKQPRVIAERCVGCGICEHVCPVQGRSAIRVAGRGRVGQVGNNSQGPAYGGPDYGGTESREPDHGDRSYPGLPQKE